MALSDLGMTAAEGYNVTEAFTGTYIGVFRPHDLFNASVDPAGVYMAIAYFDPWLVASLSCIIKIVQTQCIL